MALWMTLCALLAISAFADDADGELSSLDLLPNIPLRQTIETGPRGSPPVVRWYRITGLVPHTKYEVRVSYKAVVPTDFVLTLKPRGVGQRRLNDISDKISFTTDRFGEIQGVVGGPLGYSVRLEASSRGVTVFEEARKREVVFIIVLEELPWGVPRGVIRMVEVLVVAAVVALIVVRFLPLWNLGVKHE